MPELAKPIPSNFRHGIVTVMRELPRKIDGNNIRRMCEIRCDCGKVKQVQWGRLPYSCGCIKKELNKHNPYSDKIINKLKETNMNKEKQSKLETISLLEELAMYGKLSDHQRELTIIEMQRLTREVLC